MRMQGSNRVVRWYPHHLDMCELNEFDAANIELFADYRGYLETYANAGLAFSVLDRDGISAMFGVWQLWPGVCEAWLIPSKDIGRKVVPLHRGSLAFFNHVSKQMKIKRLQFSVHSANATACMWAERCYFQREGTMRSYGPDGADYYMYGRLFDGRYIQ